MRITRLKLLAMMVLAGNLAAAVQADTTYTWANFVGETGVSGTNNGTGSAAQFTNPYAVAVDKAGNVYVADTGNNAIRKVTPAGVVTTIADSADGFSSPYGVAVDSGTNVFVANSGNYEIRKITPVGAVSIFADSSDGLSYPSGVAVDSVGNVFVAAPADSIIQKVTSARSVTTFVDGFPPSGVAVDSADNVFVSEYGNNIIRKVTPAGVVSTFVDSSAGLNQPSGVAVDSAGNVFVADTGSNVIWKVTSAGVVTIIADNGAGLNSPSGVAVDSAGNVYVADTANHRISKGTPTLSGLTITTSSLPEGMVGTAYNTTLAAAGGTSPYSWSMISNSLPPGLDLVTSSGSITGTPTVATTASFQIQVLDNVGATTTNTFSLTINPALTAYQIWQFQYFGCTNCPQAAPDADSLGKGMSNTNQFLAGLNPTNAASVFRIISTVATGADFVVTWRAVGGKSYVVQTNAAPGSGYADACPPIDVPGSSETVANWTDTGGATNHPARFYRVRLGP